MEITLSHVVGTLLTLFGAYSCWSVQRSHAAHAEKLAKWVVIDGEVTRHRREVGSDWNQSVQGDSESFVPIVEYTVKGIRYMTPVHSHHVGKLPIGTRIPIAYNPAVPSDAVRIELADAYAMYTSVAMLLAGVVLLVLALGFDKHLVN